MGSCGVTCTGIDQHLSIFRTAESTTKCPKAQCKSPHSKDFMYQIRRNPFSHPERVYFCLRDDYASESWGHTWLIQRFLLKSQGRNKRRPFIKCLPFKASLREGLGQTPGKKTDSSCSNYGIVSLLIFTRPQDYAGDNSTMNYLEFWMWGKYFTFYNLKEKEALNIILHRAVQNDSLERKCAKVG